MHQWQLDKQLLRIAVCESVIRVVPLAAFEIDSVNKASFGGFLLDVLPLLVIVYKEFVAQFVNSNPFLSGLVLHSACEESLREEKSADPEHLWCPLFVPIIQECDTGIAIDDPGSQGFH